MPKKPLTISTLARRAGVGVETVRYYHRIGLIMEPDKPSVGYRVYPPKAVERLKFIRRAKCLGFSLSEIAALLDLGRERCAETKQIASEKLALIESKIEELGKMKRSLEVLIEACSALAPDEPCPIISGLMGK
ncbi:MAG: MerR family DNA-binding protein [Pseudomonadota bacterium]